MRQLLQQIPKAELHVHLEGSVIPVTLAGWDDKLTPEEIDARYRFTDFAGFIQSYIWVNRYLDRPERYAEVTGVLLNQLAAQNVVHAEINLSAGVILWKQQDLPAIFRAVAQEASRHAITVGWIFDAVRHFGVEPAWQVLEHAIRLQPEGVVAFGIGGDERRGPARDFRELFTHARQQGLRLTPHAGETDGPDSVWACLELGADRIGHGVQAIHDPVLIQHLREQDIPLEISISSNVATGAVASLAEHPVRRLYDLGVPLTLNTDDPAMFCTSLLQEYELAASEFGFTLTELKQLADHSLHYSFRAGRGEG